MDKTKLIVIAFPQGTTREELTEAMKGALNQVGVLETNNIKDFFNVSAGTVEEFLQLKPISEIEILGRNIVATIESTARRSIEDISELETGIILMQLITDPRKDNVFTDKVLNVLAKASRKEQKLLAAMGIGMASEYAKVITSTRSGRC